MSVSVDTRELQAFSRRLALAGKYTEKNIKKVLKVIGVIVHGEARKNAPRSMTKSEYITTLKTGKTKRRTFTTGDLKSSITMELKDDSVEIGVPSNSKGGKYAKKMHDNKGKSGRDGWKKHNRFTAAEGAKDKYIDRAYDENKQTINRAVDKLIDDIIRRM